MSEPSKDHVKEAIEKLLDKAVSADKADEAMKFSQAAVNAANARYGLLTPGRDRET